MPPAKSSAPSWNSQPVGENTQWAMGAYTRSSHTPAKTTQAANFIRSATAPVISAGVMIANISWKATNASGGTAWARVPAYPATWLCICPSPSWLRSPMRPRKASSPNTRV